ncbi:MAG: hypothetical protein HY926_02495 [Elusimicrobia bacterium]|nr:hypothetical protein [Elusimicrobiota bacterium]
MIRRAGAAAFLLLFGAAVCRAQESPNELGVGVYAGVPLGITLKHLIDERRAAAAAFGLQGSNLDFHADALTHFRNLGRQPSRGKVSPYLGLGLKIKGEHDILYGVRFLGGAAYALPEKSLEFFAEVAPFLRVAPGLGSGFDGGAGVRYYFRPLGSGR